MPQNAPKSLSTYQREYGGSAIGGAILLGTGVTAGIANIFAMGAMGFSLPAIAIFSAVAATVGIVGFAVQQSKKALNRHHAAKAWSKREGYHHEPEYAKDNSLMHVIQGKSDIPERVQYIENTWGAKVMKPGEFRSKHGGIGIIGSVLAGGATFLAITFIAPAAVAFAATFGLLAAGTMMALHNGDVAIKYDKYVDQVAQTAAKEAQKQRQRPPAQQPDRAQEEQRQQEEERRRQQEQQQQAQERRYQEQLQKRQDELDRQRREELFQRQQERQRQEEQRRAEQSQPDYAAQQMQPTPVQQQQAQARSTQGQQTAGNWQSRVQGRNASYTSELSDEKKRALNSSASQGV